MDEVLGKIASGSIVLDEPSSPTLKNVDDNVRTRVKARIAFIETEGRKLEGISKGCGPQKVPSWYDPVAFKRAQDLFNSHSAM